jgi:hypothetical protein
MVDIIQEEFRNFFNNRLSVEEERIMALFGIQPAE